jgi:hypothetical protein
MNRFLYIVTLVFLASCGQTNNNSDKKEIVPTDTVSMILENTLARNFRLTDTTVKFLWRANRP